MYYVLSFSTVLSFSNIFIHTAMRSISTRKILFDVLPLCMNIVFNFDKITGLVRLENLDQIKFSKGVDLIIASIPTQKSDRTIM